MRIIRIKINAYNLMLMHPPRVYLDCNFRRCNQLKMLGMSYCCEIFFFRSTPSKSSCVLSRRGGGISFTILLGMQRKLDVLLEVSTHKCCKEVKIYDFCRTKNSLITKQDNFLQFPRGREL